MTVMMRVILVTPKNLNTTLLLMFQMEMLTTAQQQHNQMQNQNVGTQGVSSSIHYMQAQSLTPWQIGAEMRTTRQVQTQKKKFAGAPISGWPFPKGPKWVILQEKETANA